MSANKVLEDATKIRSMIVEQFEKYGDDWLNHLPEEINQFIPSLKEFYQKWKNGKI